MPNKLIVVIVQLLVNPIMTPSEHGPGGASRNKAPKYICTKLFQENSIGRSVSPWQRLSTSRSRQRKP